MYDSIGGYFSDIAGHWAQPFIEKLAEEGIAKGSGGKFMPDKSMTRAEMAVFLARALGFQPHLEKGLAYVHAAEGPNDVELLNCSWYYGWGCSQSNMGDPRYVPMAYDGTVPEWFPADYNKYLLVYNEPNNGPPYGANINPTEAANRYATLCTLLPKAIMVVGGVSSWCTYWLQRFIAECNALTVPLPTHWHIHGYESVDYVVDKWRQAHQATGGKYWITEFAAPYSGKVEDIAGMVDFMKQTGWIERFAYFTNRLDGNEVWCPPGWQNTTPLLDWNTGQLNERGQYYANC